MIAIITDLTESVSVMFINSVSSANFRSKITYSHCTVQKGTSLEVKNHRHNDNYNCNSCETTAYYFFILTVANNSTLPWLCCYLLQCEASGGAELNSLCYKCVCS